MKRIVVALIFSACVVSLPATSPKPLRLNPILKSVPRPSELRGYSFLLKDHQLYVCWTGVQKTTPEIFLTRADLRKFQVEEVMQISEGKGDKLSPQIVSHAGEVKLAYLKRIKKGKGASYKVHFLSWSDFKEGKRETVAFDYGARFKTPKFVSTTKGLFLIGASRNRNQAQAQLRLYREREGKWEPFTLFADESANNGHEPVLVSIKDHIWLIWIRNGNLVFSRSQNGENWSKSEVLFPGRRVRSFSVISGEPEQSHIAWEEKQDVYRSGLWVASLQEDSVRRKPRKIGEILGSGLRLQLGGSGKDSPFFLLLHYWDPRKKSEVIEFASYRKSWRRTRLDRVEKDRGRSLDPWFLLHNSDLYLIWQERKRKETGIYLNHASFPWKDWLPVPRRIDEPQADQQHIGAKLIADDGKFVISYFSCPIQRDPFNLSTNFGDLYLQVVSDLTPN